MNRPLDLGEQAFRAPRLLDVLIPTRNRPAELAVTLSGLAANGATGDGGADGGRGGTVRDFGVVVSDQSDGEPAWTQPAVATMVRVLRHHGHPVLLRQHLPRRGMAEQRAYLLAQSTARYVLYLDDDVWLEPGSVDRLLAAVQELGCGFVGNAVHGLSYVDDLRPETHRHYQEWDGRPVPEEIHPGTPEWDRSQIHPAANLLHVTRSLDLPPGRWRAYKVAWVGGCVLFDRIRLCAAGGFDFWSRLDEKHQGEDVAAQLAVMRRYGGAGILPSGAYHLESPTTVTDREMEAWEVMIESGQSPPPAPPRLVRR